MPADPAARPADSPLMRLRTQVGDYRFGLRMRERGRLASIGDGIAWIENLPSASMEEMLEFDDGSLGLTYHLAERLVGAILLHQRPTLTAGYAVRLTGRQLSLPVGDALLGRVIDPLGNPLDGKPAPECPLRRPVNRPAPPIVDRDFVHQPLYTGNKIIDTLIPIGRGQRQLILGDNAVGKSTLALDTVIHQREQNVRCVVVLIGQKRSVVVDTLEALRKTGALATTALVVAEATALPGLKYLAPYAGCAIAEAWMETGHHTLVVYDDLTTHAHAYRELSLLLRRPPGREAYPGDIFFLHARLLERSTCLTAAGGGGSMTALPIIETKQGELSAFIPTNLISITDGQLYLDANLFSAGILPAIDIGKSVSRIGGKAQHPAIKQEAGRMKLDYLQFLELELFSRFGSRLEPTMARKIARGRVLRELLRQEQRSAVGPLGQLVWLVAYNEGLLDNLPLNRAGAAQQMLIQRAAAGSLALTDGRARWVAAVRAWWEAWQAQPGAPAPSPAAAPRQDAAPAASAPEAP
jgi:F-type H+-transporting ATPase subunit alpha